jgi:hypothetical protein
VTAIPTSKAAELQLLIQAVQSLNYLQDKVTKEIPAATLVYA